MIGIEGEVIIFSTVAGVGQDIAATFGEAKEDMPGGKTTCTLSHMCHHGLYKSRINLRKSVTKGAPDIGFVTVTVEALTDLNTAEMSHTLTPLSGTPRSQCSSAEHTLGVAAS